MPLTNRKNRGMRNAGYPKFFVMRKYDRIAPKLPQVFSKARFVEPFPRAQMFEDTLVGTTGFEKREHRND